MATVRSARPLVGAALVLGTLSCKTGGASDVKDDASPAAGSGATPVAVDDGPFDPQTAAGIEALFKQVMDFRSPPGQPGHVSRAVFLKPHACAKATFTVPSDLPPQLQQGLFATPGTHDAWLRISSDTDPATADQENNTIGWAIKVLGVPGQKILHGEENFQTQDFLLQNIDVFFVDTATDFLQFTNASFGIPQGASFDAYVAQHPTTGQILDAMKKPVPNALSTSFWSTMPYRFGDTDFVKYKVIPCTANVPAEPIPDQTDKNYIRTRLIRDVKTLGACFQLQVQVRTGDMPLDKATVEWTETDAPPQTVANVSVAPQDITQNDDQCENMAFTAWHALPAHQPVGSISKARGIIYKDLSDYRRTRNGVPIAEPQ